MLPLLNEYFYNDLESLTYVIGKDFYDINGNIKYLSLAKREDGQSEFEEKLINVYQV
jgi:5-methylcytosine-specific restriction protein B